MLFKYTSIEADGSKKEGTIDAVNSDNAILSLQRRGITLVNIHEAEEKGFLKSNISFFDRVSNKEIVILSRQIATLFEAQVSALRVFRLIGEESDNAYLRKVLAEVSNDIQGGSSIGKSMSKHPKVFTDFYVNMVSAGEESGKLDQTFAYLADYLDRSYEITSKARNALIYPAFVVGTFAAVMILMLTLVIPKISRILIDSGQTIPLVTRFVIAISNFFLDYTIFILVFFILASFGLYQFGKTPTGKLAFAQFKLSFPYVGSLFRKLYLTRIADNINTMIISGIPMVRVIEITASIVDNEIFKTVLERAAQDVSAGSTLSDAFGKSGEIPGIMVQMVRVGEETGELGSILKTLARFYQREVSTAVDTLVDLIEPVMIVALGIGVGFLLTAVLLPIYNISSSF